MILEVFASLELVQNEIFVAQLEYLYRSGRVCGWFTSCTLVNSFYINTDKQKGGKVTLFSAGVEKTKFPSRFIKS